MCRRPAVGHVWGHHQLSMPCHLDLQNAPLTYMACFPAS